jgi:tRNA threonylcarbamoyladenosine biosynthesis protein TsaB
MTKVRAQRILAIESSSPRLSLAIGTDTALVKEYRGPLEWRHAEMLLSGMQDLLRQARWPVQSLTGICVSTGPGSFTGLRIGMAAARALGQALKIPVVGVSALKTLAHGRLKPGTSVCPVIDALRGDVFTAVYHMDSHGRVETVWKESRVPWVEWNRQVASFKPRPVMITGEKVFPEARVLLTVGRALLLKKSSGYETVIPTYLRAAAATERRQKV